MNNFIKKIYSKITYYFPFCIKPIENMYYLYNNIKTDNTEYIKNVNKGKNLLEKHIKEKDYYYVIIDKGIGDTVIVALNALYLEKKYKKNIAFIVLNSHIDVVKQFKYIKKIIGCTRDELDKIVLYISSIDKYETDNYKYAFFKMKISKNSVRNWSTAIWDKKIILSERYKKFVFDNNNIKKIERKQTTETEISEIIKKYKIKKKSVLLIPYAYTVTPVKSIFWDMLIKKYKSKGYTVYTNIGNPKKEKVLENTSPLNISLDELYKISPHFDCIIALRCGLCEFLALNSPNMIIINDNIKNYDKWDDVNNFSNKKSIKNVYLNNKKYDKIISEIER